MCCIDISIQKCDYQFKKFYWSVFMHTQNIFNIFGTLNYFAAPYEYDLFNHFCR